MKHLVAIFLLYISQVTNAQFIPSGQAPMGASDQFLIGARYRALTTGAVNSQTEIFLGVPDLGIATNRGEVHFDYDNTQTFSITYDATANSLRTVVNRTGGMSSVTLSNISGRVAAAGKTRTLNTMNVMQLRIRNQAGVSSTTVTGIVFNGTSVPGTFTVNAANTTGYWHAFSPSYGTSFTLLGTIQLSGNHNTSAESNLVEFLFGSSNQILPITIQDFGATHNNNNNVVKWQINDTALLQNLDVEKSINGVDFETAKAQLFNTAQQFTDFNPHTITYYRLKLNGKDGAVTYSKVVKVERLQNISYAIKAYQNNIQINGIKSSDNFMCYIYTTDGRLLIQQRLSNANTLIQVSYKGIVIVRIMSNNQQQFAKQVLLQ
jgi:hypothetical protein